jgi:hypothetical protein
MLNAEQLKVILDTPEADRTAEQRKDLSDFFAAANRPLESDDKKDAKGLMTIEDAFNHPRFKELVQKQHDAEARANALEKAAQDAERKQLEEANNFKALYEKAQAEITGLKPKAEALTEMEKSLTSVLESQVKELPEQFRDIVPDGLSVQAKLEWLSKNKAKFSRPEAFDIGAGAKGAKKPDEKAQELSAEEKIAAQAIGMTEKEYLQFKDNAPVTS